MIPSSLSIPPEEKLCTKEEREKRSSEPGYGGRNVMLRAYAI
jgi:hypothetical protein